MISFTILTDTPGRLRNQLEARGIIDAQGNPLRKGLEIQEVPNIIMTTPAIGNPWLDHPFGTPNPNYVPQVMDSRRCFLVKFAHEAEDDETAGEDRDGRSLLLRTKLGKWIAANSVADTLASADGRSWPSRLVGQNFWFVDSPDFGVWQ